jgi:Mrp family chromosome partitioning ATPase
MGRIDVKIIQPAATANSGVFKRLAGISGRNRIKSITINNLAFNIIYIMSYKVFVGYSTIAIRLSALHLLNYRMNSIPAFHLGLTL